MMKNRKTTAFKIALVYVLAGFLWIFATDSLLSLFTDGRIAISWFGVAKGLVFVAASGALVYALVHNLLKKLMDLEIELLQTNSEVEGSKKEIASSYEELLKMKKKLYDMAYFDPLTGLRNQVSLQEDIEKIIGTDSRFAMIFLDIDNFKYVNDTLGHSFGNLLLKEIGNKLADMMEKNCELYRFAGDKFIIIFRDIRGILDIEQFALKILKSFKDAVIAEDKPFYHTVSIGVSIYPEHGRSMNDLLKCAEIALSRQKSPARTGSLSTVNLWFLRCMNGWTPRST